ncbi:response regulator transcription factor [Candidatus Halobeggiatoa sp. HSG11]|nr:response regulator transcription factor [Candidatus Halobeggiatoa sp. HSG11]
MEIVIAEDNPRDREFLCQTLADYQLHIATNGEEALELLQQNQLIYLVSDLQMPRLNGVELAKHIWADCPQARIVFWSQYQDEIYVRALAKIIPAETVYGYVLKNNPSNILQRAIVAVFVDYQCWIDPKIRPVQARNQTNLQNISDAEYEVLIDIALGMTDNLIAQRRYLSKRGVQSRLKSIYQKLNIERDSTVKDIGEMLNPRSRAVAIALQRGLINSYELQQAEALFQQWLKKR